MQCSVLLAYTVRHLAEDTVEYLVRKVTAFIHGSAGWDDAHVDLSLSGESRTSDDASAEVDEAAIRARQARIRIEHALSLGECKAKVHSLQSALPCALVERLCVSLEA